MQMQIESRVLNVDATTARRRSSSADSSDGEVDPYAILAQSDPALQHVTKDNFEVFLSHLTARCRAIESKRDDALFVDPFAEALCGEPGAAIRRFFPQMDGHVDSTAYVSLRTHFIDQAIRHRHTEINQLVIYGASMDSRAYRLHDLADCHVFEVHQAKPCLDYKHKVLSGMDAELLAKKRTAIVSRDATTLERDLLAAGFDPTKPSFWTLEGMIPYMAPGYCDHFLRLVNSLTAPHSQVWADMVGGGGVTLEMSDDLQVVMSVNSYNGYGSDSSVLRALPWPVELQARRNQVGEYYGSQWDAEQFARFAVPPDQAIMGPWFFVLFTKPDEDE